jgi:hypothetical protein
LSKVQCSHITTFINILEHLEIGKLSKIDHILIGRCKHSSVLDVLLFRAADCDMDHYLVLEKFRERITVNKQGSHKFYMERFKLRKLNEVRGKEKYGVEISNRFSALEDLDAEVEIYYVWETIRENMKIPTKESLYCYELKKHKPWFDEGCSKLYQRKHAKLQWLHTGSK